MTASCSGPAGLNLPFTLSTRLNEAGQYALVLSNVAEDAPLPGRTTLVVTAVVTLLGFVLSPAHATRPRCRSSTRCALSARSS